MASTGAAAQSASSRPASTVKGVLLEILIVTLIAGAIGASFAIARPDAPAQHAAEAEEKAATSRTVSNVIDLAPIVTNLATPSSTWIRLEISVIFDGNAVLHPEVEAAQIGGDVLAYLHTLTLPQLEGPIGLQNLREDLNERARIRSSNKITELVVRTLVVQ